jgi:tetratricopeptide (TPR) repeat protein
VGTTNLRSQGGLRRCVAFQTHPAHATKEKSVEQPWAIPSSLHASLMARLDRLGPIKAIAQIGAALGREFSYELLFAVADQSHAELDIALRQLTDAGLVFRRGNAPNGSFIFKHALVQDAAYSTLLRGQRKDLHKHISSVMEARFPETEAMQPEILAHHCTQGGLIDAAIVYWRKAGERALRRSAAAEAVQHLSRGIELIHALPATPDRGRRELELHLALGRMIRIVKGMAAPETLQIFSRARDLLDKNATVQEQLNVLYGLWGVHYARAEHIAARDVAQGCLALALRHRNNEAAALGNYIMGGSLWAIGAFAAARCHLEKTLVLCEPSKRLDIVPPRYSYNHDTTALSFLALSLGALGYPDQAKAIASQSIVRARNIGHVPLIAFSLYSGALFDSIFELQGDTPTSLADDAIAFCSEHGVTVYAVWARICHGIALARASDPQGGIEAMSSAMDAAKRMDANLFQPFHLGQLGVAYGRLGQPDVGVGFLDEAIQTAETTEERLFEAELFRFRGELLQSLGQSGPAEAALQRALSVAQRQGARTWELRAALSLARLWRNQGRHMQVHGILAPIYRLFTEGFETPDLLEARNILSEL